MLIDDPMLAQADFRANLFRNGESSVGSLHGPVRRSARGRRVSDGSDQTEMQQAGSRLQRARIARLCAVFLLFRPWHDGPVSGQALADSTDRPCAIDALSFIAVAIRRSLCALPIPEPLDPLPDAGERRGRFRMRQRAGALGADADHGPEHGAALRQEHSLASNPFELRDKTSSRATA